MAGSTIQPISTDWVQSVVHCWQLVRFDCFAPEKVHVCAKLWPFGSGTGAWSDKTAEPPKTGSNGHAGWPDGQGGVSLSTVDRQPPLRPQLGLAPRLSSGYFAATWKKPATSGGVVDPDGGGGGA